MYVRRAFFIVLFLSFPCFIYMYVIYPEYKAISVVDNYLISIQKGIGNSYDFIDTKEVKTIFIDVLNFKYLTTKKKEITEPCPSMIIDATDYQTYLDNCPKESTPTYDTYWKFLDSYLEHYDEKATFQNDRVLISPVEDPLRRYTFLYDVTITNRLGTPIYKKYLFKVRNSYSNPDGYKIVSIEEHQSNF